MDVTQSNRRFWNNLTGKGRSSSNNDEEMPQEEEKPYILKGGSPIDYLENGINPKDILIGDGWLERGSMFLLVAQSGIGKSQAVCQIGESWACGIGDWRAFFLQPFQDRPLRIIMVQNEDSRNDLHRQSLAIPSLKFTEEQQELIRQNFWVETVRGKMGPAAIETFKRIIDARGGCDIFLLNPLSAYAKGDLTSTEDAAEFLYGQFSPFLDEYNCGGGGCHHTPKSTGNTQKNKDKWSSWDFMYSGAGAATLTNYARAYITIDPKGDTEVFDVRMAKRVAESGWPLALQMFQWERKGTAKLWVPASSAAAEAARKSARKGPSDLRKFVPVTDPIRKTVLESLARDTGGFKAREFVAALGEALSDSTPDDLRLYEWSIDNPKGGKIKSIARRPQPPPTERADNPSAQSGPLVSLPLADLPLL